MYPIIKANYFWLLLCSLFALGTPVGSQDCTTIIKENKKIAGVQIVRSGTVTFVVRGNYNYGIEFFTDEKGIFARLISTGGIEFNQDDQVVFAMRKVADSQLEKRLEELSIQQKKPSAAGMNDHRSRYRRQSLNNY